jgi:hypothetical protein
VSQLIQILEKSMQQQTLQQQSLRAHSVEQKARKPSCQALTAIQLSFADEDDPEFISQLEVPTVDTQKAIRFSRAEQMRRRLNACSKGLLEVKTKSTGEGQNLADAKVEYLHRTVRDFVRRPDIWKKLREATTPPFDPEERLAVSVVACFKMSFEQQSGYFYRMSYGLQEGVFHRYPRFWDMLIHTMIYIYRYGPSNVDSQVRLLDELEKTIRFLMAGDILGRGVEYKDCPLNTEPDVLLISSFLHLAVKLQLNAYVKSIAQSLHREGQIDNFSNLFQMAATEYRTAQSTFKLDDPSLRLIETFLELGVNPNQPLRANPTMTVWQFVVSDSAKRPEILKLFIRYGADPFVPELDDLSEGGDDFGEFLRTKRKEATKNGTRWDDAASASKTTSKWSRLRSPKLFGRTRGRGHHSDSLTNL